MSDRYIDQDETQIYGPFSSRMIRTRVVGLVPPFDSALSHVADEIDNATSAVAAAVAHAHTADAALRKVPREKGPALKRAVALLGRFGKHLEAHDAGTVDRKVFFTRDGTAAGVGTSAARVLLAVSHMGMTLKGDTTVRDRDAWTSAFDHMAAELGPVVDHASSAKSDRADATPEVEAARLAWLNVYRSAQSTVEAVLRLRGQLDRLAIVFYDLAVPGDAKVTEIPDPPPMLTTPPPPPVV